MSNEIGHYRILLIQRKIILAFVYYLSVSIRECVSVSETVYRWDALLWFEMRRVEISSWLERERESEKEIVKELERKRETNKNKIKSLYCAAGGG